MQIDRLPTDAWQRLRAIRLRALRDAPDAFTTTFEEAEAWPVEVWRRQAVEIATFIAVVDGEDAGMVRGYSDEDRPDVAFLISMWVAAAARGRGVGDALIDAVVNWARERAFARMELDVGDENTPAIALYARKGFAPSGETNTLPPPREHIREHRRVLTL